MSGSRLGRGRVGRLTVFCCAALLVVFAVFLYRSASSEMHRLKDLHVKCAQQQEALAAQLQVIYEYKVQLENSLSNEKSANAAAKEELKQKASRERSLRDKDSYEAMQRFNSLQQNYKQLQAEHQDLKDDCKKKEDVALENAKSLEATLQDLRKELKKSAEDKEKSMQHLKTKYALLIQEKDELQEKFDSLKKVSGSHDGDVERLQKQVIQLERELDEAKKSLHFSIGGVKSENSKVLPRHANAASLNNNNVENEKSPLESNQMQVIRPSSQQQAAVSSSNAAKLALAVNPPALQSPSESSSKPSSANNSKSPTKVKLPVGVPPIPRLIEPKDDSIEPGLKKQQQESAEQRPPLQVEPAAAAAVVAAQVEPEQPKQPRLEESGREEEEAVPQLAGQQGAGQARHLGEQILERHEPDSWYKLKPGVQEVGDPHHIEKSGFENAGGNEDVDQYDDYNYKELQNKNGDLHLEEGEDEREDEDDYMHNNMNAVKHE